MLSPSDLKEKRILFISAEHRYENRIKFWNDNLRFYRDGLLYNQMSCFNIFTVFIIGDISITSQIIKKCQGYGISIFLLDHRLNEYASILSALDGNYLLRNRQYSLSEVQSLEFSKNLVYNKICNQARLIKIAKGELVRIKSSIDSVECYKKLLGIEGSFSKRYLGKYFQSIGWHGRAPRAKQDIPNLLLDIGYYYLFNFIDSLLRLYGFDTYKGIYHRLFFERRSLACDLQEPLRPMVDKALKRAYRLGRIKDKDFRIANGRYQVNFKESARYSSIFLDEIMAHSDLIHRYIKDFYVYMIKGGDLPFCKYK